MTLKIVIIFAYEMRQYVVHDVLEVKLTVHVYYVVGSDEKCTAIRCGSCTEVEPRPRVSRDPSTPR